MKILSALVVLLALGLVETAVAQGYPSKTVRVVVPFPPGGVADGLARMMNPRLAELWGQSVVIDNRAGANTIIGADHVAKSAPDGYTLLLTIDSTVSINPSLYPKLPYDPTKDFAPITLVALTALVLVAHPAVPVNNVNELVAYAKSRPGALNYASVGAGSPQQLMMEQLKLMTGITAVHVPFKGGSLTLVAMLAGDTQISFSGIPTTKGHVMNGKLRALAVSSAKRLSSWPDLPSVGESVPGYDSSLWLGLLAPAGTPSNVVARVQSDVAKVVRLPAIRELFDAQGLEPVANTPEQFAAIIKADSVKWAKVIKEAGIRAD